MELSRESLISISNPQMDDINKPSTFQQKAGNHIQYEIDFPAGPMGLELEPVIISSERQLGCRVKDFYFGLQHRGIDPDFILSAVQVGDIISKINDVVVVSHTFDSILQRLRDLSTCSRTVTFRNITASWANAGTGDLKSPKLKQKKNIKSSTPSKKKDLTVNPSLVTTFKDIESSELSPIPNHNTPYTLIENAENFKNSSPKVFFSPKSGAMTRSKISAGFKQNKSPRTLTPSGKVNPNSSKLEENKNSEIEGKSSKKRNTPVKVSLSPLQTVDDISLPTNDRHSGQSETDIDLRMSPLTPSSVVQLQKELKYPSLFSPPATSVNNTYFSTSDGTSPQQGSPFPLLDSTLSPTTVTIDSGSNVENSVEKTPVAGKILKGVGVIPGAIGSGLVTVGSAVGHRAVDAAFSVGSVIGERAGHAIQRTSQAMPLYSAQEMEEIVGKKNDLLRELSQYCVLLGQAQEKEGEYQQQIQRVKFLEIRLQLLERAQQQTELEKEKMTLQTKSLQTALNVLRVERAEDQQSYQKHRQDFIHLEEKLKHETSLRVSVQEELSVLHLAHQEALEDWSAEVRQHQEEREKIELQHEQRLEEEKKNYVEETEKLRSEINTYKDEHDLLKNEVKTLQTALESEKNQHNLSLEKLQHLIQHLQDQRDSAKTELEVLQELMKSDHQVASAEAARLRENMTLQQDWHRERLLERDTELQELRSKLMEKEAGWKERERELKDLLQKEKKKGEDRENNFSLEVVSLRGLNNGNLEKLQLLEQELSSLRTTKDKLTVTETTNKELSDLLAQVEKDKNDFEERLKLSEGNEAAARSEVELLQSELVAHHSILEGKSHESSDLSAQVMELRHLLEVEKRKCENGEIELNRVVREWEEKKNHWVLEKQKLVGNEQKLSDELSKIHETHSSTLTTHAQQLREHSSAMMQLADEARKKESRVQGLLQDLAAVEKEKEDQEVYWRKEVEDSRRQRSALEETVGGQQQQMEDLLKDHYSQLQLHQQDLQVKETQARELEEKLISTKKSLESGTGAFKNILLEKEDMIRELQAQVEDLEGQLKVSSKTIDDLSDDMTSLQQQCKRVEEDSRLKLEEKEKENEERVCLVRVELEKKEKMLSTAEKQRDGLQQELYEQTQGLTRQEQVLSQSQQHVQRLEQQMNLLRKNLEGTQKDLTEKVAEVTKLENDFSVFREARGQEIEGLKKRVAEEKGGFARKEREIKELENKFNQTLVEREIVEISIKNELENQLLNSQKQLNEKMAEITKIDIEFSVFREARTQEIEGLKLQLIEEKEGFQKKERELKDLENKFNQTLKEREITEKSVKDDFENLLQSNLKETQQNLIKKETEIFKLKNEFEAFREVHEQEIEGLKRLVTEEREGFEQKEREVKELENMLNQSLKDREIMENSFKEEKLILESLMKKSEALNVLTSDGLKRVVGELRNVKSSLLETRLDAMGLNELNHHFACLLEDQLRENEKVITSHQENEKNQQQVQLRILTVENKTLSDRISSLETHIKELHSTKSYLEAKLVKVETDCLSIEEERVKLEMINKSLVNDLEISKTELCGSKESLNTSNERIKELNEIFEEIKKSYSELKQDYQKSENKVQELKGLLEGSKQSGMELERELEEKKRDLDTLSNEKEVIKKENEQLVLNQTTIFSEKETNKIALDKVVLDFNEKLAKLQLSHENELENIAKNNFETLNNLQTIIIEKDTEISKNLKKITKFEEILEKTRTQYDEQLIIFNKEREELTINVTNLTQKMNENEISLREKAERERKVWEEKLLSTEEKLVLLQKEFDVSVEQFRKDRERLSASNIKQANDEVLKLIKEMELLRLEHKEEIAELLQNFENERISLNASLRETTAAFEEKLNLAANAHQQQLELQTDAHLELQCQLQLQVELQEHLVQVQNECAAQREKIESFERNEERLKSELNLLKQQLSVQETELSEMKRLLNDNNLSFENVRSSLETAELKVTEAENIEKVLKEELRNVTELLERTKQDLKEKELSLENVRKEVESSREKIQEMKKEREHLNQYLTHANHLLEVNTEKLSLKEKSTDTLQKELQKTAEKLTETMKSLDVEVKKNSDVEVQFKEMGSSYVHLQEAYASLQLEFQNFSTTTKTEITEKTGLLTEYREQMKSWRHRCERAVEAKNTLEQQVLVRSEEQLQGQVERVIELENQLSLTQTKLSESSASQGKLKEELKNAQQRVSKLDTMVVSKAEALLSAEQAATAAEEEASKAREDLDHLNDSLRNLEGKLRSLQNKSKQDQLSLESSNKEVKRLQKQVEEVTETMKTQQQVLVLAEEKDKESQVLRAKLEQIIEEREKSYSDIHSRLVILEKKRQQDKQEAIQHRQVSEHRVELMGQENRALAEALSSKCEEISSLHQRLNELLFSPKKAKRLPFTETKIDNDDHADRVAAVESNTSLAEAEGEGEVDKENESPGGVGCTVTDSTISAVDESSHFEVLESEAEQQWLDSVVTQSLEIHELITLALLELKKNCSLGSEGDICLRVWTGLSEKHHAMHEQMVRAPWLSFEKEGCAAGFSLTPAHELMPSLLKQKHLMRADRSPLTELIQIKFPSFEKEVTKPKVFHTSCNPTVCRAVIKMLLKVMRSYRQKKEKNEINTILASITEQTKLPGNTKKVPFTFSPRAHTYSTSTCSTPGTSSCVTLSSSEKGDLSPDLAAFIAGTIDIDTFLRLPPKQGNQKQRSIENKILQSKVSPEKKGIDTSKWDQFCSSHNLHLRHPTTAGNREAPVNFKPSPEAVKPVPKTHHITIPSSSPNQMSPVVSAGHGESPLSCTKVMTGDMRAIMDESFETAASDIWNLSADQSGILESGAAEEESVFQFLDKSQ